ncbi:hypothetical protein [uncultured Arcobacter sp.]|uniref:hypothetical protein n=1 Tax=uncultured Arcobacter sp. TaxID=165434 RepID=UPI002620EF09|nr:hypothetical protein [uncultured Arcobacter sp.]
MIKTFTGLIFTVLFLSSCAQKQIINSTSATILIKTPTMKFYDKGFISTFENYTQVQIYSAGKTVLDLKFYENRVCKSTFECESSKEFNKKYLHSSYKEDFLKTIFDNNKKETVFRDKEHNILIKIKKD